MIRKFFAITTAAVVGIGASGSAAAYQVNYGQDENGSSTFPLSSFVRAVDARNSFFAGGAPAVQDFEGFAVGTTGPLSIEFGSGSSSVTATLAGTEGEVIEVPSGSADEGRFSVAAPPASMGNRFWQTKATNEGSTFELWFNHPVIQFGFFGVDVGDFNGILELELLSGAGSGGVIATVNPGPFDPDTGAGAITCAPGEAECLAANGSVLYFGVTAESKGEWFRGVRFRSVIGGSRATVSDDVFGFDSFTVVAAPRGGVPVPTPGTAALLGATLVALSLLRRRA